MHVWERHLGSTSTDEEFADSYRGHARVELTGLFSSDRKRLLDVGCASGATSALLKQLIPGLETWGVEPDPVAAQLAAQRMDRVFAKKLEDVDLISEGLGHGDIDAVLLADVLEHMYDPWRALVQLKPFLAQGAQVVISLPNVRNVGLVSDLVDGRFDYQKWGLLDITHIRFFTLDGAVRMLHETGYGVQRVQANIDPTLSHVLVAGVPADGTVKFDRMSVSAVEPRELVEMCALQFFIVATPVQLEIVWGGAPAQAADAADSSAEGVSEHSGDEAGAEIRSNIVEIELHQEALEEPQAAEAHSETAVGDGVNDAAELPIESPAADADLPIGEKSAAAPRADDDSASALAADAESAVSDNSRDDANASATIAPADDTVAADDSAPVESHTQSQPEDEQGRQGG